MELNWQMRILWWISGQTRSTQAYGNSDIGGWPVVGDVWDRLLGCKKPVRN
jgi:hypothetical protein